MEDDREINRLVAEKVMGARTRFDETIDRLLYRKDNWWLPLPDYCNSWEAMGEVINAMLVWSQNNAKEFVEFTDSLSYAPNHYGGKAVCNSLLFFPDSAPKAVALAALKAVGQ